MYCQVIDRLLGSNALLTVRKNIVHMRVPVLLWPTKKPFFGERYPKGSFTEVKFFEGIHSQKMKPELKNLECTDLGNGPACLSSVPPQKKPRIKMPLSHLHPRVL